MKLFMKIHIILLNIVLIITSTDIKIGDNKRVSDNIEVNNL